MSIMIQPTVQLIAEGINIYSNQYAKNMFTVKSDTYLQRREIREEKYIQNMNCIITEQKDNVSILLLFICTQNEQPSIVIIYAYLIYKINFLLSNALTRIAFSLGNSALLEVTIYASAQSQRIVQQTNFLVQQCTRMFVSASALYNWILNPFKQCDHYAIRALLQILHY